MQQLRDQFLAGAGLTLDENRERRVGKPLRLLAQRPHGATVPDERGTGYMRSLVGLLGLEHHLLVRESRLQQGQVGRLGNEIDRTKRERMVDVGTVALAREHEDLHARIDRQHLGDERKALVRQMRIRRQSEIHQCHRRRLRQPTKHLARLRSRGGHVHAELVLEHELERFRDERVVIDQQQGTLAHRRVRVVHAAAFSGGVREQRIISACRPRRTAGTPPDADAATRAGGGIGKPAMPASPRTTVRYRGNGR